MNLQAEEIVIAQDICLELKVDCLFPSKLERSHEEPNKNQENRCNSHFSFFHIILEQDQDYRWLAHQ